MSTICGYLILRKPDQNYDEVSQSPYYLTKQAPCINGNYYSGIDRVPWFELDESYYKGILTNELIKLHNKLIEINQPDLDITVLKSYDDAINVLHYSNSIEDRYELAVVYSEKLSKLKGTIEIDLNIDWLGFDVYYSGYGSLLSEGIFRKPNFFSEYHEVLNSNGLFDVDADLELIESYINKYNEVSRKQNLERVDDLSSQLKDIVKIGRVIILD